MTSYFEIAGEIFESGVVAEPQTFQSLIPTLKKESERLIADIRAGPKSSLSGDGRGSLVTHWLRSVAYPFERTIEEPEGLLGFPIFGVKVQLELIEKHYEYFIKGEDPWD